MNASPSPYLTVPEVASILRVRPKTVYDWASAGRLPCYRFGGALRFSRAEIEAWATSCASAAAPPPSGVGRPAGGSRADIDRIVERARREVLKG